MMNDVVNPMIQAMEQRASQPFAPVNDDVVIGILLGCFVILVIALADSNNYLRRLLPVGAIGRTRAADEDVHTSRAFYIRISLFVLAWCSTGLLLMNGAYASGKVSDRSSALMVLLWGAAGAVAWLLVKSLLFGTVNAVLFSRKEGKEWGQTYADTFLLWGMAVFVLAVLVVFFEMPLKAMSGAVLALVGIAEIWLLFKAFRIFFAKKYGVLQLFIYLCALEWIPLLVAGKVIVRYCTTF